MVITLILSYNETASPFNLKVFKLRDDQFLLSNLMKYQILMRSEWIPFLFSSVVICHTSVDFNH